MDLKRLDWILVKALESDLTIWEAAFIDDMTDQRERYGEGTKISDRQEDVLERIAKKD